MFYRNETTWLQKIWCLSRFLSFFPSIFSFCWGNIGIYHAVDQNKRNIQKESSKNKIKRYKCQSFDLCRDKCLLRELTILLTSNYLIKILIYDVNVISKIMSHERASIH